MPLGCSTIAGPRKREEDSVAAFRSEVVAFPSASFAAVPRAGVFVPGSEELPTDPRRNFSCSTILSRVNGECQAIGLMEQIEHKDLPLHDSSSRHPLRPTLGLIRLVSVRLVYDFLFDDFFYDVCR